MTENKTSMAVALLFQDALSEPQHTLLDAKHSRAFLAKYQRMEEALKGIGSFKGNMHCCRECHAAMAEDLAKEASEALAFDPLSPSTDE